ncbi:MAG: hypothetical protein CO135_01780 [Candidatus Levybacteria bacterium CG_4_9_14_3_um_filter_35_16]|nr:MAG: hypothetical protein COW87_01420 [Candidatus Levybacteria bacterium CG22_combo_CG10-13_8_21_14_all_35_11]PIY95019.1 MAG: hypothetical protein COY68_00530 [Candidatus Levybacteria bacterium CG_4_10_14_0_8_um_filter_35_23]PJA00259.1 MAG: hypothetical protein COX78_00760 [Candidatus Levybacteria bacterium CG_4_10_14_0_2_um_filter_35_8]PJA91324.1 MAG: hypothetical protein CO135_01780 [Candidatus Levybacteria bacterium CG_4_9_14_3_um_filter_35_16]PJC54828.1 MAG: hypothetical protein CO028_00
MNIFNLNKIIFFLFFVMMFVSSNQKAYGITDPLSLPNNKFGVHILSPDELLDAAKLINTSGGDWGYVTIPIQASDKNIVKWQSFMDEAKKLHLIPIIRLATNGDYFNTAVWQKPSNEDILDFANFLNSLVWPTQNKYIIIFNEVNRGDEWGGVPDPADYAHILSYSVSIFKSRDQNFYILSSGMDNAAANVPRKFINQYIFFRLMDQAIPGIFNQIDGISSHPYPNPGFSQSPLVDTEKSIFSFKYEKQLINSLANKKLPIFITETGWQQNANLNDTLLAQFYKSAFDSAWSDSSIVAITPFLLRAGAGAFTQFSLLDLQGNPTERYNTIKNYPKIKGFPVVLKTKGVLGDEIIRYPLPVKRFSFYENHKNIDVYSKTNAGKLFLKWLLNVR